MAYEQKDNSGSLFRNDRKETDNHPDYTGSVLIGGVEYWQSAWIKTSSNGTKYMSQSFKPKEARGDGSRGAPLVTSTPMGDVELDDDVPFARCDTALEHRVG